MCGTSEDLGSHKVATFSECIYEQFLAPHYSYVIMGMLASQITSLTTVYSTVYSKLHVTGLYKENSLVTGEFRTQRASNTENVFIWWCHHEKHPKVEQGQSQDPLSDNCSGSLEPESSCHDRDWIMELPMKADILIFTGILTPEDASVASCFPFDITISLSWFPLLSIPPLHSAIP